jgi:uncharacterized membrane protein
MSHLNSRYQIMARIAIIANLFSWAALIFFIIAALLALPSIYNQAVQQAIMDRQIPPSNYLEMFKNFNTSVFVVEQIGSRLLQGVTTYLMLQAVSLGLYMLIETDLNYKLLKEEAENE